MGSNWMNQRLSIAELNSDSQTLVKKYLWVNSLRTFSFQIVSMFIILFLLDSLSYMDIGLLFAINFTIWAVLDYPTGALGDAIGYKTVLITSYLCHIISILFLITAETFEGFLLWSIFGAMAASQESGALEAWLDNNYKITAVGLDKERKIYGAFQGKNMAVWTLISGTSFILGGVIAGVFSREVLFLVHLTLVSIVLASIFLIVRNVPGFNTPQRSVKNYLNTLKGGAGFVVSKKSIFFFIMGAILMGAATMAIWANFLLFPLYEGYSGSDSAAGLLRSIIFGVGIFWQAVAARLSPRISKVYRWIFVSMTLGGPVFFATAYLFYTLIPPQDALILISFLGLIGIFQLVSATQAIGNILQMRVFLDLIPDAYRNSVYSLIPSLVTLIAIPMSIIGGLIIATYGFSAGILLVTVITSAGAIICGYGLYLFSHPEVREAIVTPEELSSGIGTPVSS
ncbi:MAG: MFS transporter [Candidatus Hodarchaeota archaeon]